LGRAQYALGKREKAMETFNESIKSSNETGDKSDRAPTMKLIGRIYLDSGNAGKALEFFSKSLEIFREVEDSQNVTEGLLLEPNKDFAEAALQANERGRARGLLNLLAESKANIREGVDAGLLQKEEELKSLLSERRENLTKVLNGKSKPEETNKLKIEIEQIR